MDAKRFVKLSNIVGLVSIVLLIYWVFIFIAIEVFGLRVFREYMTQTFYMSVLGILSLMFGALIINVMFNLTRIAEKHNQDTVKTTKTGKVKWIYLLSFPVIIALLFVGNCITSKMKEKVLIQSAKSVIDDHTDKTIKLENYSFNKKWIDETGNILELLSKTDKNFTNVEVIVPDTIDKSKVFLAFNRYNENLNDTIKPRKLSYVRETTKQEREYLNKVFDEGFMEIRFSAHEGNYELFYPIIKNNKKIVLYFSDVQRYGKIGS
ncbi:MAG: hypothetical protein ABR968_09890 [Bacteroidales bacterium]|jgi:hypothetical protein